MPRRHGCERRCHDADALARIDRQMKIVASLDPGTTHHRLATNVLLVLQDSLHVVTEARATIARCLHLL